MTVAFSTAQAAHLLGCDESTVIRRIQTGRLTADAVAGKRGGRGGQVYQIPADALRLHVQQQIPSATNQASAAPIDLGAFLARGGMEAVRAASDRRSIIQAAIQVTGPNKVEQLRRIAADAGVHLATLYTWMKSAKAEGGATLEGAAKTMRSKFDDRGMRRRTSIEPLARDTFHAIWLRLNQPTVTLAIEEYKAIAAQKGWSVPSRATFYRLVAQDLTPIERTLARKGTDTVRATLLPKNTLKAPSATGFVLVADHRQLDYWVHDEETGKAIRPWVCVLLDGASREPMGVVPAKSASAANVRAAFTMAVYAGSPHTMGLPKYFLADRGSEFRNDVIPTMLENLGVQMYLAEQGAGWAKGYIESFFNTMNIYHDRRSNAWTGNRPGNRPDELDVDRMLKEGKLETYNQWASKTLPAYMHWYSTEHKHHGDGMNGKTPRERYLELPNASIGLPSPKAFQHMFMRSEPRQISKDGIKLFNQLFWHPDLIAENNRVRRNLMGEYVTVRYDDEDKTQAFVFYCDEYVCTITPKEKYTWNPEDAENVAGARKFHGAGIHSLKVAHERIVGRQEATGVEVWIPKRPKMVSEKTKVDGKPAPQAKAPRMITRADKTVDAIEEDQRKAAEAARRKDTDVDTKVRQIGRGKLLS